MTLRPSRVTGHAHHFVISDEVDPWRATVRGICDCGLERQFNPHPVTTAQLSYLSPLVNSCPICGEKGHRGRDCYRVVR